MRESMIAVGKSSLIMSERIIRIGLKVAPWAPLGMGATTPNVVTRHVVNSRVARLTAAARGPIYSSPGITHADLAYTLHYRNDSDISYFWEIAPPAIITAFSLCSRLSHSINSSSYSYAETPC